MNVVLAPDSFKGSLSAPQVCAALEAGLRRVWPDAIIRARPMADGGEGTLDAILHAVGADATRATMALPGASGAMRDAHYGLLREAAGTVAVIEVAEIVGLTDTAAVSTDVGARSTTGIGMLMRALLDRGVRDFRIGLGGSSTNDGGAGLLRALGVTLADARGAAVAPTPDGLAALAVVDARGVDRRVAEARIAILSDVNNPLCGALGATAVFGPQKGVTPDRIERFDATLARFAARAEEAFGRTVASRPGSGAAGGLGFALQLLGGTMASGAEVVADLVKLDAALADADWAITGEGRTDAQTLLNKAPFVVAQRARRAGVPVTLLSGAVDSASLAALGEHFAGCFSLPAGPATLDACLENAADWLADRAGEVARLWQAAAAA
jgi:glycerate kinase